MNPCKACTFDRELDQFGYCAGCSRERANARSRKSYRKTQAAKKAIEIAEELARFSDMAGRTMRLLSLELKTQLGIFQDP